MVLQLLSESFEPVKTALINLTAIVQGSDKMKAWKEYLQKTSELLEIASVYGVILKHNKGFSTPTESGTLGFPKGIDFFC